MNDYFNAPLSTTSTTSSTSTTSTTSTLLPSEVVLQAGNDTDTLPSTAWSSSPTVIGGLTSISSGYCRNSFELLHLEAECRDAAGPGGDPARNCCALKGLARCTQGLRLHVSDQVCASGTYGTAVDSDSYVKFSRSTGVPDTATGTSGEEWTAFQFCCVNDVSGGWTEFSFVLVVGLMLLCSSVQRRFYHQWRLRHAHFRHKFKVDRFGEVRVRDRPRNNCIFELVDHTAQNDHSSANSRAEELLLNPRLVEELEPFFPRIRWPAPIVEFVPEQQPFSEEKAKFAFVLMAGMTPIFGFRWFCDPDGPRADFVGARGARYREKGKEVVPTNFFRRDRLPGGERVVGPQFLASESVPAEGMPAEDHAVEEVPADEKRPAPVGPTTEGGFDECKEEEVSTEEPPTKTVSTGDDSTGDCANDEERGLVPPAQALLQQEMERQAVEDRTGAEGVSSTGLTMAMLVGEELPPTVGSELLPHCGSSSLGARGLTLEIWQQFLADLELAYLFSQPSFFAYLFAIINLSLGFWLVPCAILAMFMGFLGKGAWVWCAFYLYFFFCMWYFAQYCGSKTALLNYRSVVLAYASRFRVYGLDLRATELGETGRTVETETAGTPEEDVVSGSSRSGPGFVEGSRLHDPPYRSEKFDAEFEEGDDCAMFCGLVTEFEVVAKVQPDHVYRRRRARATTPVWGSHGGPRTGPSRSSSGVSRSTSNERLVQLRLAEQRFANGDYDESLDYLDASARLYLAQQRSGEDVARRERIAALRQKLAELREQHEERAAGRQSEDVGPLAGVSSDDDDEQLRPGPGAETPEIVGRPSGEQGMKSARVVPVSGDEDDSVEYVEDEEIFVAAREDSAGAAGEEARERQLPRPPERSAISAPNVVVEEDRRRRRRRQEDPKKVPRSRTAPVISLPPDTVFVELD